MGSKPAKLTRQKISTTIAPETFAYLEKLIAKREAHTLAEAIDLLVERLRAAENRERLAFDTAAYFDRLPSEAIAEESNLASALTAPSQGIDFDREP